MTNCVTARVQDLSEEGPLSWKYQPMQLGKRKTRFLTIGKEIKLLPHLGNLIVNQKY